MRTTIGVKFELTAPHRSPAVGGALEMSVFAAANPENSLSFARLAAADHWSPAGSPEPALPETVFWSPSVLGAPNAAGGPPSIKPAK